MLKIRKKLAIAAILGSSMLIPMASYAAPEELHEGKASYTEKEVKYHFFEQDVTGTMNVVFRDDLPKSISGKIQRNKL